jgi:hypothetical protein
MKRRESLVLAAGIAITVAAAAAAGATNLGLLGPSDVPISHIDVGSNLDQRSQSSTSVSAGGDTSDVPTPADPAASSVELVEDGAVAGDPPRTASTAATTVDDHGGRHEDVGSEMRDGSEEAGGRGDAAGHDEDDD